MATACFSVSSARVRCEWLPPSIAAGPLPVLLPPRSVSPAPSLRVSRSSPRALAKRSHHEGLSAAKSWTLCGCACASKYQQIYAPRFQIYVCCWLRALREIYSSHGRERYRGLNFITVHFFQTALHLNCLFRPGLMMLVVQKQGPTTLQKVTMLEIRTFLKPRPLSLFLVNN
jgi:hypothetical protein